MVKREPVVKREPGVSGTGALARRNGRRAAAPAVAASGPAYRDCGYLTVDPELDSMIAIQRWSRIGGGPSRNRCSESGVQPPWPSPRAGPGGGLVPWRWLMRTRARKTPLDIRVICNGKALILG